MQKSEGNLLAEAGRAVAASAVVVAAADCSRVLQAAAESTDAAEWTLAFVAAVELVAAAFAAVAAGGPARLHKHFCIGD